MSWPNISELRRFYATRLGAIARHYIQASLTPLSQKLTQQNMIGLGYAAPYLDSFTHQKNHVLAITSPYDEIPHWPLHAPSQSLCAQELELPLKDNSIDCVLLVHALEYSEQPKLLMRELWRVLAPEGMVAFVVPNRKGLWAHMETTPFATGLPYSANQLRLLCTESMFEPINHSTHLFTPPSESLLSRPHALLERCGSKVLPSLGGILTFTAKKQLYALTTEGTKRYKNRLFVPSTMPNGGSIRQSHK